jgi:hypothetical protein
MMTASFSEDTTLAYGDGDGDVMVASTLNMLDGGAGCAEGISGTATDCIAGHGGGGGDDGCASDVGSGSHLMDLLLDANTL